MNPIPARPRPLSAGPRRYLGPVLGLLLGLGLLATGWAIAWTSPLLSGGQLIAGPWLILAGAAVVIRAAVIRGWVCPGRDHH